jgi:hypothetical protein
LAARQALPPFGGAHSSGVAASQVTSHALAAHLGAPVVEPETGAAQTLPHAPQFCVSEVSSKHPFGAHLSGKLALMQANPQLPIEQTAVPLVGVGQALLHAPQLARSVLSSTQAAPHLVKPASQVKSHIPPLHTGAPWSGAEQTVLQPPQ